MNLVLRNRPPLPASLSRATLDYSFERLMQGLFDGDTPAAAKNDTAHPRNLAIDVRETPNAYIVEAELPGLLKEQIRISVDAGRVTIAAEKTARREAAEGEKLIHAERNVRQYSRTFSLPVELDEGRIDARLENGLLTLTLPKNPVVQPVQIIVR
jgi:HSP20 family protein